jgi:hypothetical protein
MTKIITPLTRFSGFVGILFFLILLVPITGCVSSSNGEEDFENYLFGKQLEENGHNQAAIVMYSSSVHFGEITDEILYNELDRLFNKLGKEVFDKALEEAYAFLKDQIEKGVNSEDPTLERLNEFAVGSLKAWELLSGTVIWQTIF